MLLDNITGIQNYNTLTNQQDIKISHCTLGITNESGGGSFENHHQINITNVNVGIALGNGSTFTNFPGAILSTSSVVETPFESLLGAIFIGEGEVDIQN